MPRHLLRRQGAPSQARTSRVRQPEGIGASVAWAGSTVVASMSLDGPLGAPCPEPEGAAAAGAGAETGAGGGGGGAPTVTMEPDTVGLLGRSTLSMPWISTLHPWARSGALRMADDPMPSKETPLEKALGMMELPASVSSVMPVI